MSAINNTTLAADVAPAVSLDYVSRIRRFQANRKEWWQNGHKNPYLSSMEKIRVYAVDKSPALYKQLYRLNLLKKQVLKTVRNGR